MHSFEAPKRRALSEAELYEVLAKLPTDQSGVEKAQVVLERQAILREQDNQALESWIAQMRQIGTQEAADAVNQALGLVSTDQQQFSEPTQTPPAELFTSPIPTIGTRRKRRESERTKFSLATTFVSWSAFAGIYAVVVWILGFSLTDSVIGLAVGLLISGFAKSSLLTHKDSAIYRSAAAYGSRGYLFFALLAWFAILLWGGFYFKSLDLPTQLTLLVALYFMKSVIWIIPVVLVTMILGILGLLMNSRFIGAILIVPVLLVITAAVYSLQPFPGQVILQTPSVLGSIETTLLVAVLSAAVTVLIRPHTQANSIEILVGHSLAFILTAGFLILLFSVTVFTGWPYLVLLSSVGVAVTLFSAAVRDFFGKKLGSVIFLGLISLATLALVSLDGTVIRPYLDAFLISHLTLISFDSWLRSKPLHRASLRTAFGFYGGWSASSSLVVIATMVAASTFVVSWLNRQGLLIDYFLAAFIVATTLSLSRFWLIRAQDREVAKVETEHKDLNNLLGL